MSTAVPGHPNLHVVGHPLVRTKMTRLRDRATSNADFRRTVRELASLLAYEATRRLALTDVVVETPYETGTGALLAGPVTVVPILRAGLGLCDGVLDVLPEARVGHIGVYRDETSFEPVQYYVKLPPGLEAGTVLLVDPMVATGGSAAHAASLLEQRGCRTIAMIALVCAPEGVRRMAERHPAVPIVTAALDRELDAQGRIRPGLGDAGDRLFGTEGA